MTIAKHDKPQSNAQRLANPVWLRQQIRLLVESCSVHIKDDLANASRTCGDVSDRYRASAESHHHWKQQLERILQGASQEDVVP